MEEMKKQEEMRTSAELVQNAPVNKELAEAVMSGFFAGIQSREALPKKEAQSA